MRSYTFAAQAGLLLACANQGLAIDLDVNDVSSIKDAAATIAGNAMTYYKGDDLGEAPGTLPPPYYWWEAGLLFDSLVNYWALTGDEKYVNETMEALLWQVGPSNSYMPPNQTKSLGNDDQATWALAAMNAAEKGFPQKEGQNVSWAQLAENAFDAIAERWDTKTCAGGLRWQIFTFNVGYDYKNTASSGAFMELAARLALYTDKKKYGDWVTKVQEWSTNIGLVHQGSVYDGTTPSQNCSALNHIQWTQSAARYMNGATYMSNFTGATKTWNAYQFDYYVESSKIFFQDGNMVEIACETNNNCNTDQLAFRAVLARAYANVRDLSIESEVTFGNMSSTTLTKRINNMLHSAAMGAAGACTGGKKGTECGAKLNGKFDGETGLGQELSALEIMLALLPSVKLHTSDSTGSPTTGSNSSTSSGPPAATSSVTKSGAGALGVSMASVVGSAVLAGLLYL